MEISYKLSVIRHLRDLKAEQWLDPDRMAGIQAKRLAGVLDAARNLGQYPALGNFPVQHPDGLAALPIISKDDVQRSPAHYYGASDPFISATSSGTTGKPLKVSIDGQMAAENEAAMFCLLTDFGLTPLDSYAETRVSAGAASTDLYGIFRRLTLPVLGKEEEHMALLRKHRVNALRAYPSIAEVLANLNARAEHPLRMKFINCGAETLTEGMRRNIEASFSTEIFMNYGVSEFGFAAWECKEHSLHVNCSSVILEIVDKKGRAVKSGPGEILLTTLHNRAMPLIRYRTGDMGSWGKECACGRGWPVLKSLEGRLADVIELPSGRQCPSIKFYFPSNMKSDISAIRQYQVVQKAPGLFVFRFVPLGKGPPGECRKEIREKIVQAAGEAVAVEFEEADSIPRGPGGKFRHVIPLRH